jgi:hypothetical protein
MPQVGKKRFPYTAKGKKAAKSYAKESGQDVEKYQAGGAVNPPNFTQQNPAMRDANRMGQELKALPLEDIPTSDAMQRKKTSPMGAEVGTGMYKGGGKVK